MESTLRILPHLSLHDLNNPLLLQKLYHDSTTDYYWSDDFSARFYYAQARAGFIAVTERHHEGELLLPELQRSYAVLDFEHLHVTRHARRILRRDHPKLHVGVVLRPTAERIRTYHRHAWLTPRYERTLEAINRSDLPMHVIAMTLYHDQQPVAGEIGYIIGRTYTSLSGYSSRDKRYRHYGMVQLIQTARWLQRHGFAFWNLGQPYMPYKFTLGAREYPREVFLRRWHEATAQTLR
jgi:Leu/Phe-tRNA-protein transferase